MEVPSQRDVKCRQIPREIRTAEEGLKALMEVQGALEAEDMRPVHPLRMIKGVENETEEKKDPLESCCKVDTLVTTTRSKVHHSMKKV